MLKTEKKDGVIVVKFNDIKKFNALITEPVKDQLSEFFEKPNTKLVIDLKGVKYIDSSGFGVFLSVMKSANNNYGDLRFCNIADEVMELFKLLQLHNIFKIHPTVDECIRSFSME